MNLSAKKLIPLTVFALLAAAVWYALATGDMHVNVDGDEIDGPLGALLAVLFGGAGMVVAAVALTCVAVFVSLLFASLGVLMVVGFALLTLLLVAAISPLLLPLLIPVGIFWWYSARQRKQRQAPSLEHAV
ncbi:hypothetical protein H3H37_10550 [Duganella sp. LX20W]|uniref:Transmembrane protein n=1 Tax=Rugamonas brunnea TaxID=2758569 RepID=A0A7W2ERW5_9BURK|nr:hypothetical protein [Rugamonas brunnea]MBA5637493.1 hypothetical protein [Rugamonas brunnea]